MAELLLLGQCDNAAAPAAAAAELYVLSGGYGTPVGTDTPLLIETPDLAPAGPGGRVVWRRSLVPFQRLSTCTIQVTPIADFNLPLTATSVAFSSPTGPTRDDVKASSARTATYTRVRIEVTARTGVVQIFAPSLQVQPLRDASPVTVGSEAS